MKNMLKSKLYLNFLYTIKEVNTNNAIPSSEVDTANAKRRQIQIQ